MNNQLTQTPSQDLLDKLFKTVYHELSIAGCEHLEIHPEKVVFDLMRRKFKIEIKEIKK